MSDLENQEVEQPEVNPIDSFIDAIQSGDFNSSEQIFNDLLQDKVSDALDAEKIAVADTIFNGGEDDVEDDVEEELDDDLLDDSQEESED